MVENFGLYLKHERELRGVALDEIATTTKIHIRFLEALENNDYDNMPGEVFVKGFIRSYAKVIGYDAEEMVNAYDESVGRDRKEELEKAQATHKKTQSRKKAVAGYCLTGIALAGIVSLGYVVINKIFLSNTQQQAERLPLEEPSIETEKPSATSKAPAPDETREEEIDATGSPIAEPPAEEVQNPLSVNETHPPSEPKKENPAPSLPVDSAPEIAKAQVSDMESAGTDLTEVSEPEDTTPNETEVSQPKKTDPEPSEPLSAIEAEKKVAPKTTTESAVMEKNSESQEKPVIIQQVTENPTAPENPDQSLPESDAKPLHLKIEVQGNSWFNLTVDNATEEDFILPGGSSKNVYGTEKIRLTIGNRNGTHLFLNGQAIDLPSGSNDVIRNFDITANLLE